MAAGIPSPTFPNVGPTTRDTFYLLKLQVPWSLVKSKDTCQPVSTCAQEATRPRALLFSDSLSLTFAIAVGWGSLLVW